MDPDDTDSAFEVPTQVRPGAWGFKNVAAKHSLFYKRLNSLQLRAVRGDH